MLIFWFYKLKKNFKGSQKIYLSEKKFFIYTNIDKIYKKKKLNFKILNINKSKIKNHLFFKSIENFFKIIKFIKKFNQTKKKLKRSYFNLFLLLKLNSINLLFSYNFSGFSKKKKNFNQNYDILFRKIFFNIKLNRIFFTKKILI